MSQPVRSLEPIHWSNLVRCIKQQNCVPFIGAGFANPALKLGGKIASEWASLHDYPLSDAGNLTRVAQYVTIKYRNDLLAKEEFLDKWIRNLSLDETDEEQAAVLSRYDFFASLPLTVYMTTNYDDLMTDALRRQGKEPVVDMCCWNTYMRKFLRKVSPTYNQIEPSVDKPLVFHLHGHHSDARTLVLTEDDYIEFLITMARNQDKEPDQQLLPANLQARLTLYPMMFVGYSLNDLNFRVLFQGLRQQLGDSGQAASISVQLPPAADEAIISYLDRYFEGMDVHMYWGDADAFIDELKTHRRAVDHG